MIQLNRFKEGKQYCLTFSYDDGGTADERLVEIFNRYGMKGTFHLNSGTLDTKNHIRSNQVYGLYRGHEVACHSLTHPYPDRLPITAWTQEIWQDRLKLEQLSDSMVKGLSYPYGIYNSAVVAAAQSCGIVYSRTTKSTGKFMIPEDFMMWHLTCHHSTCMEYADKFFQPWGWNDEEQVFYDNRIFYVWGHSFEFERENNWSLIEEFCQRMSGNEKIWYATNIEIYDYIQGLQRLQITADYKNVYNPSAMTLWFSYNGENVKIEGGEAVKLY